MSKEATARSAMKLALEALEIEDSACRYIKDTTPDHIDKAITALQEALAAPVQQEPVAWTLLLVGAHNGLVGKAGDKFVGHPEHYERVDVYTSPPAQRKPLTDEQKRELIEKSALWDMHIHIGWYSAPAKSFVEKASQLIADIEAAHGIKENT